MRSDDQEREKGGERERVGEIRQGAESKGDTGTCSPEEMRVWVRDKERQRERGGKGRRGKEAD
jgi:hypothetical protein